MRLLCVIVAGSAFVAPIAVSDPMTQDQCVAAFLGSANKDWKGYDSCVRAATQLKLRSASGAANKNMMAAPPAAQPNTTEGAVAPDATPH